MAVVVSCLVAAGVFAIWALRDSDGDGKVTAVGAGHDGQNAHDGQNGHDGHDGEQVLDGCDPVAYHNTMMMFDPFAADGLLDSGCPWPYDATIAVAGGEENPETTAEFVPRRYAEIFDLISAEQHGMCSVASLPDETVNGFVFGFRVALNESGCADGVSTFDVVLREYATKAWRDSAAEVAAADVIVPGAGRVVVLGRWVVSVIGVDEATVDAFADQLVPLGGASMGG